MSRQMTALYVTPGETYCTKDGTPYKADWSGIVHVESKYVTELTSMNAPPGAAVPIAATSTHMGNSHHKGAPLVLTVEK